MPAHTDPPPYMLDLSAYVQSMPSLDSLPGGFALWSAVVHLEDGTDPPEPPPPNPHAADGQRVFNLKR